MIHHDLSRFVLYFNLVLQKKPTVCLFFGGDSVLLLNDIYMTIFNRFPRVNIRTFDAQERQWKYKTSCIPFMVSLSNFPFCNSFQNSFYMSGV